MFGINSRIVINICLWFLSIFSWMLFFLGMIILWIGVALFRRCVRIYTRMPLNCFFFLHPMIDRIHRYFSVLLVSYWFSPWLSPCLSLYARQNWSERYGQKLLPSANLLKFKNFEMLYHHYHLLVLQHHYKNIVSKTTSSMFRLTLSFECRFFRT